MGRMNNIAGSVSNDNVIPGIPVTQQEAIDHLVSRLGKLNDGDTELPRVVLLRGASGIGKSWTIQQFYNRLRETRDDQYWPHPYAEVSMAGPLASRKQIAPEFNIFNWNAAALPTFGWWGFNCERLTTGAVQSVLDAALTQIDIHLIPLTLSWQEMAGMGAKSKKAWKKFSQQIRNVLVDEGPSAVLSQFGLEVPFLSTLIGLGWDAGRSVQTNLKNQNDLKNSISTGERSRQKSLRKSEELATVFQSLTLPGLPAVIAIEDVQLMGAELSKMVDAATRGSVPRSAADELRVNSSAPVLVVGTVWPEGFSNPDLEFPAWVTTAHKEGRVEILDLQELGQDELGAVVREYAPNTSEEVIAQVTHAPLNNPHILKLWLSSRPVRRHIKTNGEALTIDIGRGLPRDAEAVFDSRWHELNPDVQDALLCATAANPHHDERLLAFVPDIINEILRDLGEELWEDWWEKRGHDGHATSDAFQEAITPSDWCRAQDDVQFFADSELASTSRRQLAARDYPAEDYTDIKAATLHSLVRWCQGTVGETELQKKTPAATLVASWYAHLFEELGNPPEAKLPPELVLCLGRALAERGEYGTAVRIVKPELPALKLTVGHQSLEFLQVRWDYAVWLGESGSYSEGIKQLQSVHPDFQAWYPTEAELDWQASLESELSEDFYKTPMMFDAQFYVPEWEEALARNEFQAEIDDLEVGPAEGVSESQRTLAVISKKIDFYEDDPFRWPRPEVIEELLGQLDQFDLGKADTLVIRARKLLVGIYDNLLFNIDRERELWGEGELTDPGEDSSVKPADQSHEAIIERQAEDDLRSTYEFLSKEEAYKEKYRKLALKQCQLLLEVATNTDDLAAVAEINSQVAQLELDRG